MKQGLNRGNIPWVFVRVLYERCSSVNTDLGRDLASWGKSHLLTACCQWLFRMSGDSNICIRNVSTIIPAPKKTFQRLHLPLWIRAVTLALRAKRNAQRLRKCARLRGGRKHNVLMTVPDIRAHAIPSWATASGTRMTREWFVVIIV